MTEALKRLKDLVNEPQDFLPSGWKIVRRETIVEILAYIENLENKKH